MAFRSIETFLFSRRALLVFLAVLQIGLFSQSAFAVRFGNDFDEERGYPDAVKNVSERSSEVLSLISFAPLAANFSYLHLTDLVKRGAAYENYLALTAEVLIAQAPAGLRLPLRKMYFENSGVTESADIWKVDLGAKLQRATFFFVGDEVRVRVETVAGVQGSPLVHQTLKLLSIIEVTQQAAALDHFQTRELRPFFPVVDIVSKITTALFLEEMIERMGNEILLDELAKIDANPALKSTIQELLSDAIFKVHSANWVMENPRIRRELLRDWVQAARTKRTLQNQKIKGMSQIDSVMDSLVQLDLKTELEKVPGRQFELLRRAREHGDFRKIRLLKGQVIVVGGVGQCDLAFQPN